MGGLSKVCGLSGCSGCRGESFLGPVVWFYLGAEAVYASAAGLCGLLLEKRSDCTESMPRREFHAQRVHGVAKRRLKKPGITSPWPSCVQGI